ncbi:radical SAM protein [Streptomyces durhamensis]|uniref:radical SAM protein n=1 Tax=Streptomyces durhamensis TaxID=68194 RepID=UPI00068BA74F|nr:radical SAM protein [Streptomyces durhamensis]
MDRTAQTGDGPRDVIWDITYACPLRCTHCYSESGRRPTRQADRDRMLRITDAIVALRPGVVSLGGGEPLMVPWIDEVARRFTDSGIKVLLYTGGWPVTRAMVERLADVCYRFVVSLDGPNAEVHDAIRGRAGSFDRALRTLELLDEVSRARRGQGLKPLQFGTECVVVRSNADHLDAFCTRIAPRFPEMRILSFQAVIPAGLASRPGFVERELPDDEQVRRLGSEQERTRLAALAPPGVLVLTSDNLELRMAPDQVARGLGFQVIQVEPDGEVRAMPVYEGTVGNVLDEPVDVLWRRALQRWDDPFVARTLSAVRTMADWAEAVRLMDHRFGTDADRARFARRPDLTVRPVGSNGGR